MGGAVTKNLAKNTARRSKRRSDANNLIGQFMTTYDKSKSGTLTRDEVRALAEALLTEYTPLVGGLTDIDLDLIMMCGGADCKVEVTAEDLPGALAVMMAVKDVSKELHELFEKYDKDGTGTLSSDQLNDFLTEMNGGEALAGAEVDYILLQLQPRDKADPIKEDQLKAALGCWYIHGELSAQDKIKEVFRAWDSAGSGTISKAELKSVMTRLAPDMTEEDHEMLFAAIDKNGNEKIEYEEFVDWAMGSGKSHF